MKNNMGNVPNLKNSNAVNQGEVQKAKQNMNSYGMTSGVATSAANLTSSTAIDNLEIKQAKQKVQNSGVQNTMY